MSWSCKDALRYALSKSVQVSPGAFEILKTVPINMLEDVTRNLVQSNRREHRALITADDLKRHLGYDDGDAGDIKAELRVLSDPTGHTVTGEGADGYGSLFLSRYEKLKEIMSARPEAKGLKTMAWVKKQAAGDDCNLCVAGLVDQREVGSGRARLRLEDTTNTLDIPVFNEELQKEVGCLMQDQFVMAKLRRSKRGLFLKEVMQPDMPAHMPNKSKTEVYAALLSDLHVGSKYFMEEEFVEFVEWLSAYDAVAKKIRFILLCGDVVDGVGIYKDQDRELLLPTVEEQLRRLEGLLDKVPKHIRIVISPGNHDPGRRALPQPAIPEKYCPGLWGRDNVTMVGNPAVVSLNGVRVLMFHGQSIDDIVKVTPGLSYDRPVEVMKYLLKARHLSPIYGSKTPIAPELKDWMVIEDNVDIFHVGHVHRWAIGMYRGTLLVNSGAWQLQTPFQMSVGVVPNPGIATIINLRDLKVHEKRFNEGLEGDQ